MKKVYLLPFDYQNIQYSLSKEKIEKLLIEEKGLPVKTFFELDIPDGVAPLLSKPRELKNSKSFTIPDFYVSKIVQLVKNPPEWLIKQGLCIYIIFDNQGGCLWAPSINTLSSFYNANPLIFLTKPIKVSISKDAYIQLLSYCEWTRENN